MQKKGIKSELSHFISKMKVPGKLECDRCLRNKEEYYPILSNSVRLFELLDQGTEGPLIRTSDSHVDPPLWFLILRYPIFSVNLLFHSLPFNFCCSHGKEKQEASVVDLCNSHLRHLSADQL